MGPKGKWPQSQLQDLLDTALNWDFEIFKLEELTEKRPLIHLGRNIWNYVYMIPSKSN